MKKSTNINIGLAILTVLVSGGSLIVDFFQNREINKIQYELNSINYKPVIKIDSIEFKMVEEKIDSAQLVDELNDSTGRVKIYTKVLSEVSFNIRNIGNTNAKIRIAICGDTISGSDKARDVFFNEWYQLIQDSITSDFYDFKELQPNDVDQINFNKEINFIENETFAVHLLVLYENDLYNLYDTYYWAKFQKKNLVFGIEVDTTNNRIINTKVVFKKNEYLRFIDENSAYKTYSKKEKKKFDKIISKLNQ